MKTILLGTSRLSVPVIAIGAMRLKGLDAKDAETFVHTAVESGANFFDHADIYGGGACEEIFARAAAAIPRENLLLQSKCGIRPGLCFDFSKEHILSSADAILRRLRTAYLDVLLLHRPDALMEPEEVADAFDQLHAAGKVRHFGVSNQDPSQIQLLQKHLAQPIVANQLQLSITNATMITSGLNVNMQNDAAVNRDNAVLNFCRLHGITIQPWSPFQFGFFQGAFIGSPEYPGLNAKLDEIAARHNVTPTTIAVAWLLRHPAKFQPVIGTTHTPRLRECLRATGITLAREEWYDILKAAGNKLP